MPCDYMEYGNKCYYAGYGYNHYTPGYYKMECFRIQCYLSAHKIHLYAPRLRYNGEVGYNTYNYNYNGYRMGIYSTSYSNGGRATNRKTGYANMMYSDDNWHVENGSNYSYEQHLYAACDNNY
jgi:hypothetical protein